MGELHLPSTVSGVLHVDLIDKNDAPLQSINLKLNGGSGWGDFTLPDSLQKGTYRIRAYTQWMRNDSHPNFFEQYISVSSVNNVNQTTAAVKTAAKPSLQFFPEGGSMIVDIPSKIAFKAVGPDGLGVNVKGVIVDNDNREVAKINGAHLGMGVVAFIPEADRKYTAKVTYADGSVGAVDLPAISPKAIGLAINTVDPAKIVVEIRASRNYYKENKDKDLNVLVYWGGSIQTIKTKLDNSILGFDLPAKNFPTGILQVTVLSQTGEPLSERMVFVQNQDMLNLAVSTAKPSYAPHGKVQLSLAAKTKDGSAASGSFSVSVTDEGKIAADENSERTILTDLLMTSDLKGYVEQPNYYFASVTGETRANLDALMLTQGFRRFVWKELLNSPASTAKAFNPETSLSISGELKTKAGVPFPKAKLMLMSVADKSFFSQETDEQGKFTFANMDFNDSQFTLQTKSASGKSAVVLSLDKPVAGPPIAPRDVIGSKYNALADILASIQNNQGQGYVTASNGSGKVLLKTPGAVTTTVNKDKYRTASLNGSGNADQVITAEQLKNISGTSLSSVLTGVARGIDFRSGVPYQKGVTTFDGGGLKAINMLIIVDGVASNSVDNVLPSSVQTVEILKGSNAGMYGMRGGGGVMVITTKIGGEEAVSGGLASETAPGIFTIAPKGYYKAREFYAPTYEANDNATKQPDTRTTIFWKPDVFTGADGAAAVNFYNADGKGTYRVVVEGIDGKGNLGRQVYRYKVE